MITILPVQGESLAWVRQTCPTVTDLLMMKDGEQELGSVGVSVGNSSLEICLLEVACDGETERRFYADSLLRAAASLAANRGAYQIVCSLSAWASFLRAEGFREEKERFVLQTKQIVKFCKD